MDTFSYTNELSLIAGEPPITFAHIRDNDFPANHYLHINNYIEVYIYISGETDYIVSNSYYSLKRGDMIVINPQEVHKAVLRNPCVYERFYILIPVNTFSKFVFDPLNKILNRPLESQALISLKEPERENILGILYKISEMCANTQDADVCMMAYTLIVKFLCLLNRNIDSQPIDPVRKMRIPKILPDILVYIDRNLPYIQSSTEIAAHFDITPQYLSTLFKSYIGTPLKIYIRTKRIALAKKMLNDGCSVTNACYESGFNDCSYFIKHFKQCIGVTPLQYKTQVGTNNVSKKKTKGFRKGEM